MKTNNKQPANKKSKRGGKRPGAGRPKRVEEQELIARLKKFDDKAEQVLQKGLNKGDWRFWQTFMQYRYGKPKESMDITSKGESFNQPIINFFKTKNDNE